MTGQVLLEKKLDDCVISLVKYQIHESTARALDRPVGSYEIVLRFDCGSLSGGTVPRASWYLSEADFVALFDKIKCRNDYLDLSWAIFNITSCDDAARLRKTL